MKEFLKVSLIKAKAWCLALLANLWEDYLKDKLKEQIDTLVNRGINLARTYYNSEAYEKKRDSVLDFVFKNIKLPVFLKPFKGLIKSILTKSIEDKIDKLFEAIDKQ